LFENGMGESYPKRGDYEYIKNKTQLTFYDPAVATKELVDEVFAITNNRMKVLKILSLAKSAIRHNLEHDLHKITLPTCLIWGKNDIITPPPVAEEFHRLLSNSQLFWIDKCGHAPMMEVPAEFNTHLDSFLANLKK
jgi:2-hydroxy-6-oxonona-2,4-dienedioate hydrolase